MWIIEWFFRLFYRKKADILKQEIMFERQKAIIDYKKAKEKQEKHLKKYSGRIKYKKV